MGKKTEQNEKEKRDLFFLWHIFEKQSCEYTRQTE